MHLMRFRLRSVMILVLLVALGLGAFLQLKKVNLSEIHDLKPRLFLIGSFVVLVVAKLALFIGTQAQCQEREHPGEAESARTSET